MSTDRTMFERALAAERGVEPEPEDTDDTEPVVVPTGGLAASKTHIGGDDVDLAEPVTSITFEDAGGLLSGEYGRPRPREFWTAKQLGRTPPMELLKNAAKRQLMGGEPITVTEDGTELTGPMADFAAVVRDIYAGPHFHGKTLDNIMADAVDDLLDAGWAYWEHLPSADGEWPVAGFKPIPPLQIQHNIADEGGDWLREPRFYQVPYKASGGHISTQGKEPAALDAEQAVWMRAPLATESGTLYGQSLATKVREWLELIIDVDVHQKRYWDDNQLPSGFLHFTGAVGEDKLQSIEQQMAEASGDPHDLVTASSEGQATWIPMGDAVVDLDAIQEQEWYFALVFAAAGLNLNELGIIEGSGFAKETPALAKQVYKNLTKPLMSAVFDPANDHTIPLLADALGIDEVPFRLTLERFDPVQEQIEREETVTEYQTGLASMNEARGAFGREAAEFLVEIDGEERNLADLPKDILDIIKPELPAISLEDAMGGTDGESESSHTDPGPPDFELDPVLSTVEAFDELGEVHNPQAVRQLEDTIEVASSFIESVAYARPTMFLQIEFERVGKTNAVYWYGSVEEFRFRNIIQAKSKGKYFNKYIRGEYTYARVQ